MKNRITLSLEVAFVGGWWSLAMVMMTTLQAWWRLQRRFCRWSVRQYRRKMYVQPLWRLHSHIAILVWPLSPSCRRIFNMKDLHLLSKYFQATSRIASSIRLSSDFETEAHKKDHWKLCNSSFRDERSVSSGNGLILSIRFTFCELGILMLPHRVVHILWFARKVSWVPRL